MNSKIIGQQVRELRRRRGFSQAQLAKRAGMSGANVSFIENGVTSASIETLEKLAAALNSELVVYLAAEDRQADALSERIRALLPKLPPPLLMSIQAAVAIYEEATGGR